MQGQTSADDNAGRTLFLLKYGELSLKGRNRAAFIRRVEENIRGQLSGVECLSSREWGRMYLEVPGQEAERVAAVLRRTFGLVGFSRALLVDKEMDRIREAAGRMAQELLVSHGRRFKIEARRSDKSFPLSSYQIACDLGAFLKQRLPDLEVDVHRPDWVLNVEIRKRAALAGPAQPAPGGLPTGSSGRGLLLLSGGIDSPVAGYLMGKRGLEIDAVYFDTPPYTSPQARDKVVRLAGILRGYIPGLRLYAVPFTELQLRIRAQARVEQTTLLVRASMMRIAERMAGMLGCHCLITGENLGQVASQTVQSMHFTGSMATLPLFRPLIGLDKEEIIRVARSIGTFETSILPYEDCCTLFAPPHPVVRPDFGRMQRAFRKLDAATLIEAAAQGASLLEET
ncbi:MAG: tRNA 4-thiouridine(8) synthase ThiI [Spirochaetales bacterium]|nr:tRNA 4-thiouridine(8) synthase ThiI [Spirochaetales bacterium]